MAGSFGGDHDDVDVVPWNDLAEVDIEAMAEGKVGTLLDVRPDLFPVDITLSFVRQEDHDDIGHFHRFRGGKHRETGVGRLLDGSRFRFQPHHYIDA